MTARNVKGCPFRMGHPSLSYAKVCLSYRDFGSDVSADGHIYSGGEVGVADPGARKGVYGHLAAVRCDDSAVVGNQPYRAVGYVDSAARRLVLYKECRGYGLYL